MSSTVLIGVDWGSSNLRAFRFDAQGKVLETRHAAHGVTRFPAGEATAAMLAGLRDWLEDCPGVPLLLCGMAGSKLGWREAPYLPAPVDLTALSLGLVCFEAEQRQVAIIPGVSSFQEAAGFRDVMRGEETQALGLDEPVPLLIAPGTHSKWIRLEGATITGLHTAMTGELYAVLRQHSLIAGVTRDGDWDAAAFRDGLDNAYAHPDWLTQLFGVRARGVLGDMPPSSLAAWLSGLLIGYELAQGLAQYPDLQHVAIVASAPLSDYYASALNSRGIQSQLIDGDHAVMQGLWRIAKEAKLA